MIIMSRWSNLAVKADRIAIPFWIILIIYAIWQIKIGNTSAWLVLAIISAAFIIDCTLIIKNKKIK